jgi:hypothetical protein
MCVGAIGPGAMVPAVLKGYVGFARYPTDRAETPLSCRGFRAPVSSGPVVRPVRRRADRLPAGCSSSSPNVHGRPRS